MWWAVKWAHLAQMAGFWLVESWGLLIGCWLSWQPEVTWFGGRDVTGTGSDVMATGSDVTTTGSHVVWGWENRGPVGKRDRGLWSDKRRRHIEKKNDLMPQLSCYKRERCIPFLRVQSPNSWPWEAWVQGRRRPARRLEREWRRRPLHWPRQPISFVMRVPFHLLWGFHFLFMSVIFPFDECSFFMRVPFHFYECSISFWWGFHFLFMAKVLMEEVWVLAKERRNDPLKKKKTQQKMKQLRVRGHNVVEEGERELSYRRRCRHFLLMSVPFYEFHFLFYECSSSFLSVPFHFYEGTFLRVFLFMSVPFDECSIWWVLHFICHECSILWVFHFVSIRFHGCQNRPR